MRGRGNEGIGKGERGRGEQVSAGEIGDEKFFVGGGGVRWSGSGRKGKGGGGKWKEKRYSWGGEAED